MINKNQMTNIKIPANVTQEVNRLIDKFNQKNNCEYVARYKKGYLYLDRNDSGCLSSVCRLRYRGDITNWDFTIFKYSNECYDEDECFFPGSEHVNGTVEGAMLAGLKAYPF